MDDLISRKKAIDALAKAMPKLTTPDGCGPFDHEINIACEAFFDCMSIIDELQPAAQPEPLTDKEQRIFLAAMRREEEVCEEVDRNYVREPYEDSLMRICKEITRKVRGALWT